jgi:signal transduction histidine kinase
VVVLGEHKRLRRMVDQVIDNALRYSPSTGEVSVSVGRDDGDAVVTVVDQGIGIPPEEMPRVFDRLFRGSNALEGRYPGTGLGLSSALAIAEGHGGAVAAGAGPTAGAVLTIRLPAT